MHFSYIGPNSFYKLTMSEITRLQRGYNELHKEEIEASEKNHKHTGRRESDNVKLAKLKARIGE